MDSNSWICQDQMQKTVFLPLRFNMLCINNWPSHDSRAQRLAGNVPPTMNSLADELSMLSLRTPPSAHGKGVNTTQRLVERCPHPMRQASLALPTPDDQSDKVLVPTPALHIAEHYSVVLETWLKLEKTAANFRNTSSADERVDKALKSAMRTIDEGGFISRFGYCSLLNMFCYLETLIKHERRKGMHPAEKRATIAIDRFRGVVGEGPWPRARVLELRRRARRWRRLAGPSVFYLMVYSENIDPIV
jgi:hypothetical protein